MEPNYLLIQTHWTDFKSYPEIIRNPEIGIAYKAKSYFDNVILVCGNSPENSIVHDYAHEIGVVCFEGDLIDVSRRFRSCMERYEIQSAARILTYQFMADCENRCDYVILPRDFDLKFGGDVFSIDFLEKVFSINSDIDLEKGIYPRSFQFCPWAAVDIFPEAFELCENRNVPVYGLKEYEAIRCIMDQYYPERSQVSDMSTYRFAAALLDGVNTKIADIACGHGDGSAFLAETNRSVTGIDYALDLIDENKKKFGDIKNLEFICADASARNIFLLESLDAVVSIHSMEHFPDDEGFLLNCSSWLKSDGKMILEVPLLMKYPFKGIGKPLGERHIREYEIKTLCALCEKYFKIESVFGVSRGNYLASEKARNAVMLLLGKRN